MLRAAVGRKLRTIAAGQRRSGVPSSVPQLGCYSCLMRYLHTMIRVCELDAALAFFCGLLGLQEVRRRDSERGRFTLVFLSTSADEDAAMLELTHNWDQDEPYIGGRNFGHLARC